MQIVTFDFHNTVARCDAWFDLEIRSLPAAVLERLGERPDGDVVGRTTELYRDLRRDVIASGVERDATTCVLDVFGALGFDHTREEVDACVDALMRECLSGVSAVPGAVESITALIDGGTPVGIISSAVHHDFLEWSLETFGLLDRLAFVATSASIGFYKSVPAVYEAAYALADADLALGVHIGDSPRWDVETAQRAGLSAILYQPSRDHPPADSSITPDLVLHTLIDAAEPITSMLGERRLRAAS